MLTEAAKDPFILFDQNDQARVRDMVMTASERQGPATIEIRTAPSLGSTWVRLYYDVKRTDDDGKPVLGVGLLLNIDMQKKQELELSEAQKAAEFANRTKTEFLANMSHELRTPLNAILGFSEMISMRTFGPIGAKYLEYANDIHASGRHLLDLVNDVLDLSKLEAGKLELHASEINLASLIDECVILLQSRAEAGQVALNVQVTSDLPDLMADHRGVKQVLLNLLSNAVKFTPAGGQVEMRALMDNAGRICLSVSDSGIGMSAAEIEIALSPFGQVDSQIARRNEGTGLGLPICKSLMELHGGGLTISSAPGAGTTLTACFPASASVPRAGRALNAGA
jgi:two-component system cell cycle sensor histidine kinase PleC